MKPEVMRYLLLISFILSLSFIHKPSDSLNFPEPSKTDDIVNNSYYEGTLDDKIPIRLFLSEYTNDCNGELMYNAMYKYDTSSAWILLHVFVNHDNSLLNMVEINFTGSMFLEKELDKLKGSWISPDAKKQYKIHLDKVYINSDSIRSLSDEYEEVYYLTNDC